MVFQAGFISFIRTILFIAAFFFVARLISRYLLPLFLKRFIRKQQENFYNQYSSQAEAQEEEGKVKVKSKGKQNKKKDELGDYVEYEEIDESD